MTHWQQNPATRHQGPPISSSLSVGSHVKTHKIYKFPLHWAMVDESIYLWLAPL